MKGAIRIRGEAEASDPGTIQWDSSTEDLQVYDGTQWRSLIRGGGWEIKKLFLYKKPIIIGGTSGENT